MSISKFEEFNRVFFGAALHDDWLRGAVFTGKKIMMRIGPANRANIVLSDAGYSDRHDKFLVEIVNSTSGKVDSQFFRFKDEFTEKGITKPGCAEMRNGEGFHIWHDGEWYIWTPSQFDRAALATKIAAYISMYEGV